TERWFTARSPRAVWNFIESCTAKSSATWVFAHNMHFDFFIIHGFPEAEKRGWKLKQFVLEPDVFIVKFIKPNKTLVFVDTFNYVKASVKQLGKAVNLNKLSVDFKSCTDDELERYCQRDVEIIKRFVLSLIEFLKCNDLGSFAFSLGGIALNVFRHRFMKEKIFIHKHSKALELEKTAYRGGRNECFKLGEFKGENFYKLDVNSMYPYVMLSNRFPVKLVKVEENPTLEGLKRAVKRFAVIADVEIEVSKPVIGLKLKKLIFPLGRFRATLCSPELELVEKYGKIVRVFSYALYECKEIFSDYVRYLYNEREEFKKQGNKVFELICKLLLNSLYGKFGQKRYRLEVVGEGVNLPEGAMDLVSEVTGQRFRVWVLENVMYRIVEDGYTSHSFLAIPAFVTAYARCYLWDLMEKAGLENVYYVDTDSLIVNQSGYENLKHLVNPSQIGLLKLEKVSDYLKIEGAKQYTMGSEVKRKGVKKEAVQLDCKTFQQPVFKKAKGLLKERIFDKVVVVNQVKQLKNNYDKGIVEKDGTVKPFSLPEQSSLLPQ
ncbi:MAG: DNA polymerase, partial [Candidatus Nezhaarchaeales archaeon]